MGADELTAASFDGREFCFHENAFDGFRSMCRVISDRSILSRNVRYNGILLSFYDVFGDSEVQPDDPVVGLLSEKNSDAHLQKVSNLHRRI